MGRKLNWDRTNKQNKISRDWREAAYTRIDRFAVAETLKAEANRILRREKMRKAS